MKLIYLIKNNFGKWKLRLYFQQQQQQNLIRSSWIYIYLDLSGRAVNYFTIICVKNKYEVVMVDAQRQCPNKLIKMHNKKPDRIF